mmetsp:Transcript_32611/g.74243  ORF Transcript_32611/g.74243 Transcript_32611/m.74243 type:complete len:204 (-) Transcript_32611:128-739(-)
MCHAAATPMVRHLVVVPLLVLTCSYRTSHAIWQEADSDTRFLDVSLLAGEDGPGEPEGDSLDLDGDGFSLGEEMSMVQGAAEAQLLSGKDPAMKIALPVTSIIIMAIVIGAIVYISKSKDKAGLGPASLLCCCCFCPCGGFVALCFPLDEAKAAPRQQVIEYASYERRVSVSPSAAALLGPDSVDPDLEEQDGEWKEPSSKQA